jgi:hypothetical protein
MMFIRQLEKSAFTNLKYRSNIRGNAAAFLSYAYIPQLAEISGSHGGENE